MFLGRRLEVAAAVGTEGACGLTAGKAAAGTVVGALGSVLLAGFGWANFGPGDGAATAKGIGGTRALAWVMGAQDREAGVILTGRGMVSGRGNAAESAAIGLATKG